MNGQYYRLLVILTIKMPMESNDIELRCSRTLPFQPVEGLTLVIANDNDEEHEITLGPPRYEFAESAFVEYQEDEALISALREGYYTPVLRDELIKYYQDFGFTRVIHREPIAETV